MVPSYFFNHLRMPVAAEQVILKESRIWHIFFKHLVYLDTDVAQKTDIVASLCSCLNILCYVSTGNISGHIVAIPTGPLSSHSEMCIS